MYEKRYCKPDLDYCALRRLPGGRAAMGQRTSARPGSPDRRGAAHYVCRETIDEEEALKLQKKMASNTFTLQDMLEQLQRVKKMGPVESLLEMIPGFSGQIGDSDIDTSGLKYQEAIILSMTKKERENYLIIGPSRRKRIAKGSGTSVAEVNRLIKQFEKTKLMMKKFSKNKGMQAKFMGQMGGMF